MIIFVIFLGLLEEHAMKVEGGWQCTICPNFFHKTKHHTLNHVESVHFPNTFWYTCAACSISVNTRKKLEHHKRKCPGNMFS